MITNIKNTTKKVMAAMTGKGELVLDTLGIKHVKKGSHTYFLCPNPEHEDKHASVFSRAPDASVKFTVKEWIFLR